ncbi:uncharacterized protein A4U43_C07F29210 [Asparagus officinalis]|uniref:Uncharacterized protein n=1 Tax=Asparagus officinalis TaxID=4686 RepID=A0A5P1EFV4_ASPOF|nr:uncharacterized protein A4U43_C07F29210 [Asparagus officinalis]
MVIRLRLLSLMTLSIGPEGAGQVVSAVEVGAPIKEATGPSPWPEPWAQTILPSRAWPSMLGEVQGHANWSVTVPLLAQEGGPGGR